MRVFRILTYYLTFVVVTNLIRNKRQFIFTINGLFLIASVVGIAILAQAVIGESVQLMPGRVESAGVFGVTYSATRILPPGQTLIYVLFTTGVCLLVFGKNEHLKLRNYFIIMLTGIGVTLTYNRSYWVACILSFILIITFADPVAKKRIIIIFLIWFSSIMISLFILSNFDNRENATIVSLSDRFSSLFMGKKLYESDSLEYRKLENQYAFPQIAKNAVFGIGLSNDYRPKFYEVGDDPTYYIHNGYLWILLKTGLIGLLPLLWFFLVFIIRGYKNWRKIEDNYFRSLLIGFTLSGTGVVLITFVIPMFMQWFSIIVLSTIVGISETIINFNKKQESKISNG